MSSLASAPQPSADANRRVAPRLSAMRDGQAFRPDGLAATVLIVDISDTGVRVRVRGGQVLPDDFVLADPRTWLAHRVAVVWRRDADVGVVIRKTQNLRGVIPGALQPAKAFCERASR